MTSLTILGLIGFIGFLCQWFSSKVKLPAILFLLLSGVLLGPVFSVFDPNELFGDLLFPFISLSVAVILFEGALTLKRNELKEIGQPVRRMVSVGVVVNAGIMTVAAHYLIGMSWSLSALFGALMVVTGPTVIMPMLKTVRPTPKIADVLRWEGIVIDPIGALIAVLVFEWIAVQNAAAEVSEIFTVFAGTVAIGFLIGVAAGYAFGLMLRHHLIPEKLHNFASLAAVCFVFAISDDLMHESGLLAVTVMGMLLANMKDVHIESILEFKEDLTVVFVSALFIVLAARLDFEAFAALGWGALVLLLVMQFIARPLKVAASFRGSDFTWKEQAMISWIGPRGIVAAAVSSVFALRLTELGVDGADKLVPLAFSIIIGTVVLQSLTARPMAKALGVAMPATQGVLIIGANPFSIALAESLAKQDVHTILCDTNWENLKQARSVGLNTYYGNPSSEHAHMHLNISPYGMMLGLSSHFEYNVTQANSFRDEFGARNVYTLAPNQSSTRFHKHVASPHKSGRILFSEEISYSIIRKKVAQGCSVKVTELSDEFGLEDWLESNPTALMLLVLKPSGDIVFNTIDDELHAEPGVKIIYLSESKDKP
ncbi:sodium:proton antiporter [Arenicella sp. 4NH20-0111]|uniref:cation:proton antiporter n=1 Tax=Arenicella sp. 4NH20-0111 TaxID=3127648 RepID=UPI00310B0251